MSVDALESRAYKLVYYGLWIMDEDDILSKLTKKGLALFQGCIYDSSFDTLIFSRCRYWL